MKKIQAAGGPQIRRQNQRQRRARPCAGVSKPDAGERRIASSRWPSGGSEAPGIPRRRGRGGRASGTPSLLGGCHHDEEVKPGTIFFNLSHENFSNKTYFLTGGGKTYRLTKVSDAPDVLERARRTQFLSPRRSGPANHPSHRGHGVRHRLGLAALPELGHRQDPRDLVDVLGLRPASQGLGVPRLPGRPGADAQRPASSLAQARDVWHRPGAERAGPR